MVFWDGKWNQIALCEYKLKKISFSVIPIYIYKILARANWELIVFLKIRFQSMKEWINPWPDWSIQVWNVILLFFLRVLKCWTWNIFGHVRQNRLLWMKAGLGSHLWKVIFFQWIIIMDRQPQKYRLVHRKWVNLLFGELRLWHDISEKGWNRYCLHKEFVFRRLEGQQEDILRSFRKKNGLIH